jgi:hypothetical protein
MDFLFEVAGLSVPLIQEIVWVGGLKYDLVHDCLHPPYFITKNSIPIENHSGHNLAQHAKLRHPKWIGVPVNTSKHKIQELIQRAFKTKRHVHIQRLNKRIIYAWFSDYDDFQQQATKYKWSMTNNYWTDQCTFVNTKLTRVNINVPHCQHNLIQQIDVRHYSNLTSLIVVNQRIQALDLQNCINLETIVCYRNPLLEINISGCVNLRYLDVESTNIKTLDISSCINLNDLIVIRTPKLRKLNCLQNRTLWIIKVRCGERKFIWKLPQTAIAHLM